MKPWRDAARALVLDPDNRTVLVHFDFPPLPRTPPGGGVDAGESDEQALRRELREELGLLSFELGPLLWHREHEFDFAGSGFRGQRERCYLVHTERFDPAPQIDLAAEHVTDVRWWTVEELSANNAVFAPRKLPKLVADLLALGVPRAPLRLGT